MYATRLTVDELSKSLNIPAPTIYRWRKGKKVDMHIKYIKFLAKENKELLEQIIKDA